MLKFMLTRLCLTAFALTALSLFNSAANASSIRNDHTGHDRDGSVDLNHDARFDSHHQDYSVSGSMWLHDRYSSFHGKKDDDHNVSFSGRHGAGHDDLFLSGWLRDGSSHDDDDSNDHGDWSYGYLWNDDRHDMYWGPGCYYDFDKDHSVVPVPAAAWLFVSGAGLLGLVSRRQKKV